MFVMVSRSVGESALGLALIEVLLERSSSVPLLGKCLLAFLEILLNLIEKIDWEPKKGAWLKVQFVLVLLSLLVSTLEMFSLLDFLQWLILSLHSKLRCHSRKQKELKQKRTK
jgi:hypothetical protein